MTSRLQHWARRTMFGEYPDVPPSTSLVALAVALVVDKALWRYYKIRDLFRKKDK